MQTSFDPAQFIPIVLCAGFGNRLRPLTELIPKAVCPIGDKPIGFHNIEQFFKLGFESVHCNTHYLASTVETEIRLACTRFGYSPNRVIFWHEKEILETGGGIYRILTELIAQDEQNKHKQVIVCSGDIYGTLQLSEMLSLINDPQQKQAKALMSTLPTQIQRKDAIWISPQQDRILGFGSTPPTPEARFGVFTNYQILNPDLIIQGHLRKESSIDMFYRKVLLDQSSFVLNHNYQKEEPWFDIGTLDDYAKCLVQLQREKRETFYPFPQVLATPFTADYAMQDMDIYPISRLQHVPPVLQERLKILFQTLTAWPLLSQEQEQRFFSLLKTHLLETKPVVIKLPWLPNQDFPLFSQGALLLPVELLSSTPLPEPLSLDTITNLYHTSLCFFLITDDSHR